MTLYSFEEVMGMDQALHHLAVYEVTKGMIVMPKSQEEFIELQAKIAHQFNYFKTLIQNRECTFQYIKRSVLQKNGPFPNAKPFDFDNFDFKQLDEIDDIKEKEVHGFAEELLRDFLPSIPKEVTEDLVDKLGIKISVHPLDSLKPDTPQIDISKASAHSSPKKRSRKKTHPKKN